MWRLQCIRKEKITSDRRRKKKRKTVTFCGGRQVTNEMLTRLHQIAGVI